MLVSAQQYNILASYSYHIHNKQLTQIMSCHVILLDNVADDDDELPESLDLPTIEPFLTDLLCLFMYFLYVFRPFLFMYFVFR